MGFFARHYPSALRLGIFAADAAVGIADPFHYVIARCRLQKNSPRPVPMLASGVAAALRTKTKAIEAEKRAAVDAARVDHAQRATHR